MKDRAISGHANPGAGRLGGGHRHHPVDLDARAVGWGVTGRHYRVQGVHRGPQSAHDIGIWVGAGGPRALDLTGRLANG